MKIVKNIIVFGCLSLSLANGVAVAFQITSPFSGARNRNAISTSTSRSINNRNQHIHIKKATTTTTTSTSSSSSTTSLYDTTQVEQVLESNYPIFHSLIMSKSKETWKELNDSSSAGYTIFAVTDEAMNNLGPKRLSQLDDDRNGETAEKMASYHAVNELVTAAQLFNSAGVITIGGVVDVGRSVSGGFFGIGGKEDGGTTVNGARMLATLEVGNVLIHEMDALISPEILWRYCDQLRIPGSK